ncbi:MAG: sigma-70 family RNA polymerase sigma factor [Candidatus Eisenbacteria bacterium]|nr:sigma-70 family RNA polymerase sigma factor [Candidatus Eisenbacteria bacterium]
MPRPPVFRKSTAPYRVPTPAEEQELVAACLAGDAAAWRRLLSRYETVIWLIPKRFGLCEEDAAEVFQAVCLALFRGLPRLKQAAGLTRWVLTTTHRQSRDLARKRRREAPLPEEPDLSTIPDQSPSVADLHEEAVTRVAIRAAIDRLAPRCAELLRLLYLEADPLSYREVAKRFDIPEGTVGPTRARCLSRLREILEKELRGSTK